jgi:hypothetical protein
MVERKKRQEASLLLWRPKKINQQHTPLVVVVETVNEAS